MNFAWGQVTPWQDEKLLMKADNAFDFGDYLSARRMYEEVYRHDSISPELNYKLGVCNFEIKKYRTSSKKYFSRTSAAAFPETHYYLGLLYHLQHDFDTATFHFHEYLKTRNENSEHTAKEIEDLVEKCHTAELFQSNPDKDVQIENLGPVVNTQYAEYGPLIPAEENFIIFTSRRKNQYYENKDPLGDYFEDIYVSYKKDSMWTAPIMLDTSINKPYHDAATGLSADGEKLLSYHTSPDHVHGHIYESKLRNGTWTAPVVLGPNVNSTDYIETSACYSPDGEMIFFSSNRPGGYGGKDLYSVKKLPNGKWAKPLNLGPTINTEYNEDAPFVHPSDNILFFSSEGHKNMGGYDVFKSTYDEREKFTTPVNLNYPINTVDDDIFFVLNIDASRGYFSSQREGGFGSYDIYSVFFEENNIPLSVYNVHVKDESGEIIKNVEIRLTDKVKKEIYGEYRSNRETGKVLIISKPEKFYRFTIEAKGFEPLILNTVLLSKETSLTFTLVHKHHD
jgi:tetratricopeptide (TPR) repeat protein